MQTPNTSNPEILDLSNEVPVPMLRRTTGTDTKTNILFPRPTDKDVKKCRIMIVDDEESVTLAVKKYLHRAGFREFYLVTDATRAIYEIRQKRPDLVLLDVRMPINGLAILEKMREDDHLQHLPVITLTCDTDAKTKIKALNLGADDFLTKPVDVSELVARVRNTLAGKVTRDQLARYSSELESDALRDELTEIANRRAFHYELNRRIIEWNRQRTPLSLLLIDLDFFKQVNDRYGHPVGDRVLRAIAHQIDNCVREMDLVARFGGEEFAVILPSTRPDESRLTAERIRDSIASKTWQVDDQAIRVTVSIGVATAMNGDDAATLIRRTDTALYSSKQQGRNRTCYHDGAQCKLVTQNDAINDTQTDSNYFVEVDASTKNASIYIVDDEPSTLLMVKKLLNDAGYTRVTTEEKSVRAFKTILKETPDLVLLDIRMPEVNGLEILQSVRHNEKTKHVPIVFLTSSTETEIKVKALELGCTDFLQKPVNASELIARVHNSLLAKAHLDQMEDYSNQLEHEVRLRTAELFASRREAIQCLARAAEIRDDETGQHVFRVGRYAAIIAQELGFSNERIVWLEHAAQLHDVGKIGIPDEILRKPSRLSADEFEIMQDHCRVGSRIIRDMGDEDSLVIRNHANMGASIFDDCNSPIMRMAAVVAETHHEKWDGSGYPNGLKGEDIPIEGRITAVADVFDALSTKRHYKDAMPLDECFDIIESSAATHFDPNVVAAFLKRKIEILDIFYDYNETAQPEQNTPPKSQSPSSDSPST